MGENSSIEWTDHTWNPWIGCTRVSQGCVNCYAEALAKRYGKAEWGPAAQRVRTSAANWHKPLMWNRKAEQEGVRRRVFCASLADIFEDNDQLTSWRKDAFDVMAQTPALDWLLLTKRPENITGMVPSWWATNGYPRNVWIGTSVENQAAAEKRIPVLLSIPARIRFLSCEPLLEEVDLSKWIGGQNGTPQHRGTSVRGCEDGRAGDRQQREYLESGHTERKSLGRGNHNHQPSEAAGRARQPTLSDGENDVRQNPLPRPGTQASMAPLQWADSTGCDDQPQEWEQEGQPPVEPGAGDLFGASDPCIARPEAWARSTRGTQFDGQVDGLPSQGDQRSEKGGDEARGDREPIRSDVSDNLENRQRAATSISWVICGGESGPHARQMHPDWARSLRDQCNAAGVAFFMKQMGGVRDKRHDLEDMPEDLRIRAFPEVTL